MKINRKGKGKDLLDLKDKIVINKGNTSNQLIIVQIEF